MKKYAVVYVLLAILMAFVLSACTKTAEEAPAATEAAVEEAAVEGAAEVEAAAGETAVEGAAEVEAAAGEIAVEGAAEVEAVPEGKGLSISIVTSSGIDDGSFNENCYDGAKAFVDSHPDSTLRDVKEPDLSKLIDTVATLVGDYDAFVLPGYNFAGIGDIATANPDKYFLVVDSTVTDSEGNMLSNLPNVYTMTFQEEQGGFFAGVAAALTTKTNKVAVVNGIAFPSNVNYQFGFMAGVNYANAKFGTKAELVELPSFAGTAAVPVEGMGENVGGNYVGSFADEATGKEVGKALIDAGADVILVAAGSSGNGVFTAAKEAGNVFVIGCDVDQYDDGVNGDKNIILTSALKIMDVNVTRQLEAIYDGKFVGMDATLGVDTDSVGYVSEAGRQQLSDETLEKLAEVYPLLKDGTIVPPSNFNGMLPDKFTGLE